MRQANEKVGAGLNPKKRLRDSRRVIRPSLESEGFDSHKHFCLSTCRGIRARPAQYYCASDRGTSFVSHGTGDDYQLGYRRCLRIEDMRLRFPLYAVIVDPCLWSAFTACLLCSSRGDSAGRRIRIRCQPWIGSRKSQPEGRSA